MRIFTSNDSPRATDRGRIPFAAALIAAVVVVLGVSGVASAQTPAQAQYGGKTTICHRTGSATNPFVVITVSNNALPAHKAHGDTLVGLNGTCPGPPIGGVAGVGNQNQTPTPPVQGGDSLPFTGLQLTAVVAWALALVLVGIALAIAGRRGPTRTTGGDGDGS